MWCSFRFVPYENWCTSKFKARNFVLDGASSSTRTAQLSDQFSHVHFILFFFFFPPGRRDLRDAKTSLDWSSVTCLSFPGCGRPHSYFSMCERVDPAVPYATIPFRVPVTWATLTSFYSLPTLVKPGHSYNAPSHPPYAQDPCPIYQKSVRFFFLNFLFFSPARVAEREKWR